MTDIIKDLAHEAIVVNCTVEQWCFTTEELERFGQSIAKQCIDECWYDLTPKEISNNIRKKFGLEMLD